MGPNCMSICVVQSHSEDTFSSRDPELPWMGIPDAKSWKCCTLYLLWHTLKSNGSWRWTYGHGTGTVNFLYRKTQHVTFLWCGTTADHWAYVDPLLPNVPWFKILEHLQFNRLQLVVFITLVPTVDGYEASHWDLCLLLVIHLIHEWQS